MTIGAVEEREAFATGVHFIVTPRRAEELPQGIDVG
jgi:hypothetical protein